MRILSKTIITEKTHNFTYHKQFYSLDTFTIRFDPIINENLYILQRRSKNSGKGVHIYKGVGVRFADFILYFLNIP